MLALFQACLLLILIILCSCSSALKEPAVEIVYYTFIHPQRWSGILPYQLDDLRASGLLDHAYLNVIFTLDDKARHLVGRVEESIRDAVGVDALPRLSISHTFRNHFEYTGLKLLHDKAVASPQRIFLYFHGKGMVFHRKPAGERIPEEIFLSQQVILPWRKILPLFTGNEIHKVGFTCSPEGYVWFNYYWIRGSYLAACKPPTLSNERYTYEHYIADQGHCKANAQHGCFNTVSWHPQLGNASSSAAGIKGPMANYTGLETLNIMNAMIGEKLGRPYNGW